MRILRGIELLNQQHGIAAVGPIPEPIRIGRVGTFVLFFGCVRLCFCACAFSPLHVRLRCFSLPL